MNAVWMRARSELRTRFAAIVSLALIVGVIGGVVIAAAAGARRTLTAYPRFLEAENALDVVVEVDGRDSTVIAGVVKQIQGLPQVLTSSRVELAHGYLQIPGLKSKGTVFPIVSFDGRFGFSINRPKILQGRMLDPGNAAEIVPSFAVANDLGLRVGESVRIVYGDVFSNGTQPKNAPPPVTLHVVGIGAMPSMFQPLAGGYLPGVLLSPAFARAHAAFMPSHKRSLAIRLRRGGADLPAFQAALRQVQKGGLPPHTRAAVKFSQASQTVGVQQTTRAQAVALWALAALVAVAGLAIFAQALARQTFIESIEYPTLRSLGVSPSQLVAVGMIRAGLVGIIGAAIAGAVGFLLSPLTPTGVARIAEPNPGFAFDGAVIGLGVVAIAVLVTLVGAVPAWRGATAKWTPLGTAEVRRPRRRTAAARFIGSFPPTGRAGVRMALDPGAGRTAVPVRTTMFGAAVSLMALAASLSFGASLTRLESTPSLSGWNWSTVYFSGAQREIIAATDENPQVTGYALGDIADARVGSVQVPVEALDTKRGTVGPSVIEGRAPTGADEIALGTDTMSEVGAHIGGSVSVHSDGGTFPMRVVGRIAMPNLFFAFTRPGQGAAMSVSGVKKVAPEQTIGGVGIFAQLAPGVDPAAFDARLKKRFHDLFALPPFESSQLSSLNQVGQVPLILAGILALMAAATLAHTLITSIRRRRGDLAILKTLGFVRNQVSWTVAWQATALGTISLAVGLPLGVVAGRWGWNVFANHLGVVPDAVLPPMTLLLSIPATILVANLLAVMPGRIASRLRPGVVLRAE